MLNKVFKSNVSSALTHLVTGVLAGIVIAGAETNLRLNW